MMVTRHFYLKSTPEGSQFWPVETVHKGKDYWILTLEGQKSPVRLEEDGVLKTASFFNGTPSTYPASWEKLQIDGRHEYMRCADIPAILPDPLVRVMVRMDELEDKCADALTEDCKRLLFSIADDNKNKRISVKEMKMAGAMLAGLATVIESGTAPRKTLDKALYESLREADRIAAALGMGKKGLSYTEFSGFAAKADSILLQDALASVGSLFPALTLSVRPRHGAGGR